MTELDRNSFEEAILDPTPTFVDFWARWCMPCKIFSPVLEELSSEMDGKINFAKIDIDENRELAVRYRIESIPTVILFKNGKPVDQMIGVHPKQEVMATLKKHL